MKLNDIKTTILAVTLILSQLLFIKTFSFRWVKEVTVAIFIIAMLSAFVWKYSKPIAVFILWSLINFILTKSYIIRECVVPQQYFLNPFALLCLINIVLYGFFYYALHNIELDKKLIYNIFCLIAIAQVTYIFVQKMNIDQWLFHLSGAYGEKVKKGWPVGFWGNESLVAWCLSICSPYFLGFEKLKYRIGYGLTGLAIFFTQCSIGMFTFLLGFLVWMFFKNQRIAVLLLIMLILCGILLFQRGKLNYFLEDTHRFKVWKRTLEIWQKGKDETVFNKKPITGYGLASFKMFPHLAPEVSDDGGWVQTHNCFLQVLYEHGLVGFLIIMWLLADTARKFRKEKLIPFISLVSTTLIAFVGFPFRTSMAILAVTSLVLYET